MKKIAANNWCLTNDDDHNDGEKLTIKQLKSMKIMKIFHSNNDDDDDDDDDL